MLKAEDMFHVGVVVPDLEKARSALAATGGLSWTSPTERDREVWTASDGTRVVRFRVSHSRTTFQVELVEEVIGTIWTADGPGRLHHLGYWALDLEAESAELCRSGFPIVARTETWIYHQSPFGFYLELLRPRGGPPESTHFA